MARTPAQRGPFGRWLKRVREERYATQAQAIADIRRLSGTALAPSEFAQWESGSRVPRPENPKVQALYEFFGSQPVDDVPTVDTASELVAALQAQTKALSELAEEVRAERRARVEWERGLLSALRELAGDPSNDPAPTPLSMLRR